MESSSAGAGAESWLDATVTFPGDRAILNEFAASSSKSVLSIDRILALQADDNTTNDMLGKLSGNTREKSTKTIQQVGSKLLDKETKRVIGVVVEVHSAEGQDYARSLVGSVEWIVLHCIGDWTMIPVENLIAACWNTGTKLAVYVDNVQQLPGVYYALQTGPDAVVLSPRMDLWDEFTSLQAARCAENGEPETTYREENVMGNLDTASVTDIKSGMVGDRVCLDLIQSLDDGEGVLVGSSAKLLCLVHGESTDACAAQPFTSTSPQHASQQSSQQSSQASAPCFRVNTGPVHSYILMADGSTKYLCEVEAGDQVAVVTGGGGKGSPVISRGVAVGRSIVQPTPMVLIEFVHEASGKSGTLFLEQTESVKVVSPTAELDPVMGWRPLSVTALRPQDQLFVVYSELGTHVGKRVISKVNE